MNEYPKPIHNGAIFVGTAHSAEEEKILTSKMQHQMAVISQTPDFDDGALMPEAPKPEPKDKGGRPKGFDGTRSKANSHVAQAFKRVGLDWREDLAKAIMRNDRNRIKLWLKLLPHLIVSSRKSKVKRWKGKPSKAALIALETLEGKDA